MRLQDHLDRELKRPSDEQVFADIRVEINKSIEKAVHTVYQDICRDIASQIASGRGVVNGIHTITAVSFLGRMELLQRYSSFHSIDVDSFLTTMGLVVDDLESWTCFIPLCSRKQNLFNTETLSTNKYWDYYTNSLSKLLYDDHICAKYYIGEFDLKVRGHNLVRKLKIGERMKNRYEIVRAGQKVSLNNFDLIVEYSYTR